MSAAAAHLRFDELMDHHQQVFERQHNRRAQVHDQFLLPRAQRGLQPMQRVAGILHPVALAPASNHVAPETALPSQFGAAAHGGIAASVAGVVVAFLCKAMIMPVSAALSIPQSAYATPCVHATAAGNSPGANIRNPTARRHRVATWSRPPLPGCAGPRSDTDAA